MIDQLIEQLPNGTSALAIIIVVLIFLKNQQQYVGRLRDIGKECHEVQNSLQKNYQESLKDLMAHHLQEHQMCMERLGDLTDKINEIDKGIREFHAGMHCNYTQGR